MFLVVGALICSYKDSKFIHLASQNLISVMGPGYLFGVFRSSDESLLNTCQNDSSQFFRKAIRQRNLVRLVGPLDDDAFDVVFQGHVAHLSLRLTHFLLLFFNDLGSLLREWKQSLAFDVSADLIHGSGQLMHLEEQTLNQENPVFVCALPVV